MHPLPKPEFERIQALSESHILAGPAPDLDTVVTLVRNLLHVPICMVSLVGIDRLWVKARCGIDFDEADRGTAFCTHALISDEVLVVEDTLADVRFSDNPLVTRDQGIRFYAGAPLFVRSGVVLGTLCVLGTQPRKMERSEILILQELAKVVTGLVRGHGRAHEAASLAEYTQEQERALRIRERRFLQTERIARIGGWEVDLGTKVVSWSDETYRIYGIAIGTPVDHEMALLAYPPAARRKLNELNDRALRDGTGYDAEFEFLDALGAQKWVRTVGEVELHDGEPKRLFGIFQDVTDRHRAEKQLWKAANFDDLTGLFNRNHFDEILRSKDPARKAAAAMLMVDADHLKDVNDMLGHDVGDELIREIAKRLRNSVGEAGTVARVGGDEFGVLLAEPIDAAALEIVAARIVSAMHPRHLFKGITLKPGVSIGGAIRSFAETGEDLRVSADLALYHAKEDCRGGYVPFSRYMKLAITARTTAVDIVDEALVESDILAYYQPIVELSTGRISGLEALARVRRPDGIHSIGVFANALQDRRTATRLTARMLELIEADIIQWRNAGVAIPCIAFNVGALDFLEGAVEAMVMSACARSNIQPSQFAVEVTESVFLSRGANLVSETVARLRAHGVSVALDDFGTGHASLAHLGTFPVDVIKMDRSFVTRMGDSGPGAIVAGTLIDLAHKLDIKVVAEGVEYEAQLDQLVGLGCTMAQGYYFSPALPPSSTKELLAGFRSLHQFSEGNGKRLRTKELLRRTVG